MCYTYPVFKGASAMAKNITLAIDEELLNEVRLYAVQHNTSVNALVRTALESLAERIRRQESEWDELFRLADEAGAKVGTMPTRDEMHDRS